MAKTPISRQVCNCCLANPADSNARETVGDQLLEMCEKMGFDFLPISDPDGKALAGVVRTATGVMPFTTQPGHWPQRGLMIRGGDIYQIASVAIDQGEENIGQLSVGERFDLSEFSTPAVLLGNGKVLESTIPGISLREVETAFKACRGDGECDLRLGGRGLHFASAAECFVWRWLCVRSVQNVDSATRPVQSVLNRVFLAASIGMVLMALLFSVLSSQSIVRPITAMISHLRKSESTGLLPEFTGDLSPIREIGELTLSFNRAASAIREARQSLQRAYLESVGSLASALDARDRYTAGHSGRVSELSCATAMALGVPEDELEDIRIGALLHDIGKIGISDIRSPEARRVDGRGICDCQRASGDRAANSRRCAGLRGISPGRGITS